MARNGAVGQGVSMRSVQRLRGLAASVLLLSTIAVAPWTRAQTTPETTPELTEEQLQILQDLPPEEREALIEQYLKAREQGGESRTTGERPAVTLPRERDTTGREVRPLSPEEGAEAVGRESAKEQLKRLKALQELKEPRFK